jgi:hypothetical protein
LVAEAASTESERYIEDAVREYTKETITFPSVDRLPEQDSSIEVALNPALEAVVSSYVANKSIDVAVFAALVERIEADIEDLAANSDTDKPLSEIKNAMEAVA